MLDKIIIIGNGIAAISAIKAIREVDKDSEIHLFGEEPFYPYSRIRLSKGLLSSLQEDKILIQNREWYDDNNINLYIGSRVISIDVDKKVVKLFDGGLMSFTKVLLAGGSSNIMPNVAGINKNGVYTLRTLKDAWDIKEGIKDKKTVLVIGGGVQGIEIAWSLSQMGKNVIIAQNTDRLMSKQLDKISSEILQNKVAEKGVKILVNTEVTEITGRENVEGFKLSNGEKYDCDAVIYSIGTKPNIDFLKGTPINLDRGVIVNNKMETNIEGIYAAGDIAQYNGNIFGLWNIAIEQGKVAGYNIAGKDAIYKYVPPVTTLNAFDLSLFSMGIVDEALVTNIVVEEHIGDAIYKKIFIKDNLVKGAIVVGNIKLSPVLKAAIEKKISLDGVNYINMTVEDIIQILKAKLNKEE
ncbi:MAG TPA: FAD-dependent oxidoreductase [Tissierellaceae bacterium]